MVLQEAMVPIALFLHGMVLKLPCDRRYAASQSRDYIRRLMPVTEHGGYGSPVFNGQHGILLIRFVFGHYVHKNTLPEHMTLTAHGGFNLHVWDPEARSALLLNS